MTYNEVLPAQPDPSLPVIPDDRREHRTVPLDELAGRIRDAYRAMQEAASNALDHGLDMGDLLNEAQARVAPANWKGWLAKNIHFNFGVSTACLYQQLARHRDEIEAERDRVGELSLRAARRLISKPAKNKVKAIESVGAIKPIEPLAAEQGKKLDVAAILTEAPAAEVTRTLATKNVAWLLSVIPPDWRLELARRIDGLRPRKGGEPALLTESEILRQAVSHIRTAGMAADATASGISENQALTALRALATALTNIDIDRITLVNRYAKEKRVKAGRRARHAA